MSLLNDRWEQAAEGMGQVVLLVGEPGLGKSRLVYDLKEHVAGDSRIPKRTLPSSSGAARPIFRTRACTRPSTTSSARSNSDPRRHAEARFERLVQRLSRYDLARQETVPLWASLLSLPTTDRFPSLALSPAAAAGRDLRRLGRVAASPCRAAATVLLDRRGLALGGRIHLGILGAIHCREPARSHPHTAHLPSRIQDALAGRRSSDEPRPQSAHATPGRRVDAQKKPAAHSPTRSSSRSTTAPEASRCSSKNSRRWCKSRGAARRIKGGPGDRPSSS